MSFEYTPLGELLGGKGYIRGPFGSALKRDELKTSGIPVYEQQHAIYGTREFRYFIDEHKFNSLKRFCVEESDLIISCSGTVGKISIINANDPLGIISQALLILRPNSKKIIPEYLYYFFSSKKGFNELINASQGAVQLNIAPRNIVEKILIPTPSTIDEQYQIVSLLQTFDKKIELNNQINQTLEAMAQAIFKSWFVDFVPVKAKMAVLHAGGSQAEAELAAMMAISGKTAEQLNPMRTTQIDAHQQLTETAALFPAAMQESELGEIPEGWEVQKVNNLVKRLVTEKRYSKSDVKSLGMVPVYEQGSNILLGFHNGSACLNATKESPIFIFGDHTCVMHISCKPFDVSANVISLQGKQRSTVWTYYALLGKQTFQEYRRHWSELIVKDVVIPTEELATKFTEIITENICLRESLIEESLLLTQQKDSLLTKLLTGEIDVTTLQEVAND